MDRIIVIGCGGIGSALIEPLVRFTQYDKPCEFSLIDGDIFEADNASRQKVSINELNRSKSDVATEHIKSSFDCVRVNSVRAYISPSNIRRYIKDNDTIMLCVDNHATRKLVQEHCLKLRNTTLISGGNDWTDGNIQVFKKEQGKIVSAPITKHHPEIEFPKDKRPDEIGCAELAKSDPQLLFTNFMAAALMLNAYYAIKENKLKYSEVYFDIINNQTKTFKRG